MNFHYAYREAVAFNYGLGKAISYDESGFLGRDDAAYRRQAWNFMLSGGSAFDGLDYSFSIGHEDGRDLSPNGPGGGSPSFRKQLSILRQFLDALPLASLAPDHNVVAHASAPAYPLSSLNREYAIYLDGEGAITDTISGRVQTATRKVTNRSLVLRSPQCEDGIALRITRK